MAMGMIQSRVRPVKRGQPLRTIGVGFVRLIFPTIFLVAIYTLSFYLLQSPVWFSVETENALADPAWWMTLGHLSLGLAFFSVALTNRAHGPTMAIAHVVLAWTVIAALLAFAATLYGYDELRAELMPTRIMEGFLAGLFAGHLAAIMTFDWQRGVPWWKAPLISALVGPAVFVLIFYPFGHNGADVPWGAWMGMHFAGLALVGIVMLIPYAMLRRMIKPAPGLGGA